MRLNSRPHPQACDNDLLEGAGIPAAVVMEMIGDDSEKMSEHYTHVGQEAMRKAAEALPGLVQ